MNAEISFRIELLDKDFELNDTMQFEKTARITFLDKHDNVLRTAEFGVADTEVIYERIHKGEPVNLSNCYVRNFSLVEYRMKYGLDDRDYVKLTDFSAINAFFEADDTTDFSFSQFEGVSAMFVNSYFGSGNLSFYKAKFSDLDVDISNCVFGHGNTNFQFTTFGNGNVTFENSNFNNGHVSFVNADFKDGRVNFKSVNFGDGAVEFHFSKFGKGDKTFDKAIFKGQRVDFRKIEFGDGKLDFRRAEFGNADVHFDESEFGSGRNSFKRAQFGSGRLSFEMCIFQEDGVTFENAEFGVGTVSFHRSETDMLSFKSCQLNGYMDLRVDRCKHLELADVVVRDVIDLKTGFSEVNIGTMDITGMRNLGKIIIDWEENNVGGLIENQTETSDYQKAEQFRILKEDFHGSGQYNDEDKAYVKFKRYELKHLHRERLKNKINAIWAYPAWAFQQLVFDKMGRYATDPLRVLISMFTVYTLYSLIYWILPAFVDGGVSCPPPETGMPSEPANAFYFSAITFLTVGYGDCLPYGIFKTIAPLEGWMGVFLMSYFTVAFVRKIIR